MYLGVRQSCQEGGVDALAEPLDTAGSALLGMTPDNLEKRMATRNERRRRAKIRKASIEAERKAAFIANERAKIVKANLAVDNREVATVYDHWGRAKLVRTNAYSRIKDSFVRTVEGGGLRECLNLDRPSGDTDREITALKKRLTAKPR